MRILTLGCSWTEGYGLENKQNAWPYKLGEFMGAETVNLARSGADNYTQLIRFYQYIQQNPFSVDLVVFGLTSPARIPTGDGNAQVGLAYEPENSHWHSLQKELLPNLAYTHLMNNLGTVILGFQNFCESLSIDYYSFRVFDDAKPDNFATLINNRRIFNYYNKPGSMFEWLVSEKHGYFQNRVDIYEPGYLYEGNKSTEQWMDKNMPGNWRKGQVERESLALDNDWFDWSGHPNAASHEKWARNLVKKIESL